MSNSNYRDCSIDELKEHRDADIRDAIISLRKCLDAVYVGSEMDEQLYEHLDNVKSRIAMVQECIALIRDKSRK